MMPQEPTRPLPQTAEEQKSIAISVLGDGVDGFCGSLLLDVDEKWRCRQTGEEIAEKARAEFGDGATFESVAACAIKLRQAGYPILRREGGRGRFRSHSPNLLYDLEKTIRSRKSADTSESYSAQLLQGDADFLLGKIAEEAAEVIESAKAGNLSHLPHEFADLWFHCIAAMVRYNIGMNQVMGELQKRRGVSGHAEKAARPPQA